MVAEAPAPAALIFQCPLSSLKEKAISAVVEGWEGYPITHVSIMMDRGEVIEAVPPGVRTETWETFLRRLRREGHRHIIFGIPVPGTLPQLPEALVWLRAQKSQPYNHTFLPSGTGWYCSQLAEAFYRQAGAAPGILPASSLNYFAPGTTEIHPFWSAYYAELGLEVPQGLPGSHPALQSRADCLKKEVFPIKDSDIQ